MAKKKLSMSAKIRNLLDKKVEPQKIAKQLKITPAYVHTIKWAYANKGKKKVKAKKAKARVVAAPVQTELFPLPPPSLNEVISKRIEEIIAARINSILENL